MIELINKLGPVRLPQLCIASRGGQPLTPNLQIRDSLLIAAHRTHLELN